MTTSPVMTVTDELLAELESGIDHDVNAIPGSVIDVVLSELRRLRAENAELAKDAGRYRFLRDKEAERGPSVVDIACWTAGATCIALTYVDADDVDGAVDISMAAQ